jgi:hypothetical protein
VVLAAGDTSLRSWLESSLPLRLGDKARTGTDKGSTAPGA